VKKVKMEKASYIMNRTVLRETRAPSGIEIVSSIFTLFSFVLRLIFSSSFFLRVSRASIPVSLLFLLM